MKGLEPVQALFFFAERLIDPIELVRQRATQQAYDEKGQRIHPERLEHLRRADVPRQHATPA